ncbi:20S proteasome subunit beta 7 [Phakopsora pachyrhizi]|nr:20S proteasome subunit beta 7 [Phakopsora pachyrhizi]
MDHFPGTSWGKPRNEGVDPYATFPIHGPNNLPHSTSFSDGVQKTQQPIVTGTSVLGIKYKDGVMLAADMLASYGSLARFKDIRRIVPVGEHTIIGAGGDLSDFQYIQKILEDRVTHEVLNDDGHNLTTPQIFEYLARVMYNRRSKGNPLWNSFVVGGVDKESGEPFLSYVDLLGTTYSAPSIATGYGSYIAQPLLRKVLDDLPNGHSGLTEEVARKTLEECMKVLFYRDARSLNKFLIAKVTSSGVEISEPLKAPTEWSFAEGLRG